MGNPECYFLHVLQHFQSECPVSNAERENVNVNLAMLYYIGCTYQGSSEIKCPVSGVKSFMVYRV